MAMGDGSRTVEIAGPLTGLRHRPERSARRSSTRLPSEGRGHRFESCRAPRPPTLIRRSRTPPPLWSAAKTRPRRRSPPPDPSQNPHRSAPSPRQRPFRPAVPPLEAFGRRPNGHTPASAPAPRPASETLHNCGHLTVPIEWPRHWRSKRPTHKADPFATSGSLNATSQADCAPSSRNPSRPWKKITGAEKRSTWLMGERLA